MFKHFVRLYSSVKTELFSFEVFPFFQDFSIKKEEVEKKNPWQNSGDGESGSSSSGGDQSPLALGEEIFAPQSAMGVGTPTIPSSFGSASVSPSSSEHRTVQIEGDGSRMAEVGSERPHAAAVGGNPVEMGDEAHTGETPGSIGGYLSTMVTGG